MRPQRRPSSDAVLVSSQAGQCSADHRQSLATTRLAHPAIARAAVQGMRPVAGLGVGGGEASHTKPSTSHRSEGATKVLPLVDIAVLPRVLGTVHSLGACLREGVLHSRLVGAPHLGLDLLARPAGGVPAHR